MIAKILILYEIAQFLSSRLRMHSRKKNVKLSYADKINWVSLIHIYDLTWLPFELQSLLVCEWASERMESSPAAAKSNDDDDGGGGGGGGQQFK